MTIYTDTVQFAEKLFGAEMRWDETHISSASAHLRPFLEALTPRAVLNCSEVATGGSWGHALLIESARESQFDVLNRQARLTEAPADGLICVAGTGKNFHGFKNRPWEASAGNLHLSALVGPRATIEHVGVAFIVMAVVSILETMDDLGCLPRQAAVKWVNDIMIDGAKIGGVLANCQILDDTVTHATIGIGLNVERAPDVPPTPFVPAVASLHQVCTDTRSCSLQLVFQKLMMYLGANYAALLSGGYANLLELYRSRSLVLGKRVRLYRDAGDRAPEAMLEGLATAVGNDLELFLDSAPSPVSEGRLELLTS